MALCTAWSMSFQTLLGCGSPALCAGHRVTVNTPCLCAHSPSKAPICTGKLCNSPVQIFSHHQWMLGKAFSVAAAGAAPAVLPSWHLHPMQACVHTHLGFPPCSCFSSHSAAMMLQAITESHVTSGVSTAVGQGDGDSMCRPLHLCRAFKSSVGLIGVVR